MEKKYKEYNNASAFDIMDEFIYIIDIDNYDMLFMNKLAKERFNVTDDSIKGKKCYEILRGINEPCSFCGAAGMTMDNVCRWLSHNKLVNEYHQVLDTPVIYKGRAARVEMSVDITSQVMQRQKLKAALDTETAMLEALHILNDSLDINYALNKMLEYLGMCFGAERTYIYEKQENDYVATYSWNRSDYKLPYGKGHRASSELINSWIENSAHIRQHQNLVENFSSELGDEENIDEISSLVVPLEVEGETVGILGMDSPLVERIDTLSVMMTTLAYFTTVSMVGANNRHSLELLSYSDAMTHVSNRNAFIRDIRRYKENFAVSPKPVGVIYLDLNALKKVNDTQGHEAGDKLIVSLADAISFFFRRSEIYRVGGDEFIVIAVGITEELFEERVAKIKNFISEQTELSVSVGSSWTEDGNKLDTLIDNADELMYAKKQSFYQKRLSKK